MIEAPPDMTPNKLRLIAEALDIAEQSAQRVAWIAGQTHEPQSQDMQRDLRRWADGLEAQAPEVAA